MIFSLLHNTFFILDILCQTCFDIKYQVHKTVFAKTVLTLYANYILRIAQRGMGKCELPHNENKCGNADLFSFALGRAHTPQQGSRKACFVGKGRATKRLSFRIYAETISAVFALTRCISAPLLKQGIALVRRMLP